MIYRNTSSYIIKYGVKHARMGAVVLISVLLVITGVQKIEASHCRKLAENGNCDFYIDCIDTPLNCEPDDYPRAFGYNYCKKFKEVESNFDEKGKTWSGEVRPCLMRALLYRRTNPQMTCERIGDIAFQSHFECYKNSGQGFCHMIDSDTNYDVMRSTLDWDLRHFIGAFIRQMLTVFDECELKRWNPKSYSLKFYSALSNVAMGTGRVFGSGGNDLLAESAANAGDCQFYEYFEEKFKCEDKGFSQITEVELPTCLEGMTKKGLMDAHGENWYKTYQRCVMGEVLKLYNTDQVSCGHLPMQMRNFKNKCMASSETVQFVKQNALAIDLWTNTYSFPYIYPREEFSLPVSKFSRVKKGPYYCEALRTKRVLELAKKEGELTAVSDLKDLTEGDTIFPPADKASGEDVVDAVVIAMKRSDIFPDDHCFLRRIAIVESIFGTHKDTYRTGYYGGIWQVDKIGFEDTQNTKAHPGLKNKFTKIKEHFQINWEEVKWKDLTKPLHSALGARLLLSNKPGAIPTDLDGQATYWKDKYNSDLGAGTPEKFKNSVNSHEEAGACTRTAITTGSTGTVATGACLCLTGDGVNVRSQATTGSISYGKVDQGECFEYTGRSEENGGYNWKQVKYSENENGWIADNFLETADQSACTSTPIVIPTSTSEDCMCITTNKINIRKEASTKAAKAGLGYKGECHKAFGEEKEADGHKWTKLHYFNPSSVWIATHLLEKSAAKYCSRDCAHGDEIRLDHAGAVAMLDNIDIVSSGSCSEREKKTCTSLDNIRCKSIKGVNWFKKQIHKTYDASSCEVVITGGTEIGHSLSVTSHYTGYKIDLRLKDKSKCVTEFIENTNETFTYKGTVTSKKWPRYTDHSENIYTKEINIKAPHWDIKYP